VTDRQLLIQAARGHQPAFTALYQRYGARLYVYFVQRLNGDRARGADLKQQVFLKLLESKAFREADKGPDDLSSLLFTIAANLLKNEYRGDERRRRREATYNELRTAESSPQEPRAETRRVALAIEQLPDHQRLCVELRFQKGLSTEQTAEAIGCSPGTVKSRLHYGLKKLADLLKATEIK
jgi:RNA polymerase sigma-70 factor (ECF subfamily)